MTSTVSNTPRVRSLQRGSLNEQVTIEAYQHRVRCLALGNGPEAVIFPSAVAFILAKPVIKHAEDFRSKPYLCPAKKWTIGWGTTYYPDGKAVTEHDPDCTQAQAENWLTYSMIRVEARLKPLILTRPTAHQWAALLSLAYNIGVGTHDGIKGDLADSTLLEKLNTGDTQGAADQFLVWNKAHVDGKLTALAGLTLRRDTERHLFLTPDR